MTATNNTNIIEGCPTVSNQKKRPIRAIIFDMDGTLLDTETLSDKAILLATFGGKTIPPYIQSQWPMSENRIPWELKRQLLGLRGSEWAPIVLEYAQQHWIRHPQTPTTATTIAAAEEQGIQFPNAMELWKSWEDHLNDMCETEVEACAGAKELLRALSTSQQYQQQLPMAIATSSRYAGVEKKRKRHEMCMFEYIQVIVAGDDPAVQHGKPAPDIYLEAARRLQVPPEDCLVLEDALSGVKAGKAAGCRVVAIPDPRYTPDERAIFMTEGGADVVLNSLWDFDGRPFGLDVVMSDLKPNQH